ncbi:MAG: THUMP domain-containing protein [Methanomassiliicoccaceae archaeon]|nr:THUMP domain-containing protein [Methanomassiliicoccaceae archaeon]
MPTILARYSEIGLKSTPVRVRFENRLRDNIITMLAADRIEALVTKKDARFYIETESIDKAAAALKRVFGIASFSITEVCSSDMEDICSAAAEYSLGRLSEGDSFAVKARREGSHGYTSVDVGREAGSAIFIANESRGVRVDLTNPDVIFYIEVRNNKAFVFGSSVRCHGGLPVGTQGKVLADVRSDRDVVSAWLMMKRGCKVIVRGGKQPLLERYDPELRYGEEISPEILGIVSGAALPELESLLISDSDVPMFFPTVGMSDGEVSSLLKTIKEETAPPEGTGQ